MSQFGIGNRSDGFVKGRRERNIAARVISGRFHSLQYRRSRGPNLKALVKKGSFRFSRQVWSTRHSIDPCSVENIRNSPDGKPTTKA